MGQESDDDFDIFGDFTAEETAQQQERKRHFQETTLIQPHDSLQARRVKYLRRKNEKLHQVFNEILTRQECLHLLTKVDQPFTSNRHNAFPTNDKPLRIDGKEADLLRAKLMPQLSRFYGFLPDDLDFLDLFIVHYSEQGQKGLEMHSDGCLLSFNILLNHESEFEGGGTQFDHLKDLNNNGVISIKQGDCLTHDARIMHAGYPTTKGKRIILVGFVETKRSGSFSKQHIVSIRNQRYF